MASTMQDLVELDTLPAYEAPAVGRPSGTADNEAVPVLAAIAAAAGAALGVSAAFVAWVCLQCPDKCRSLPQTIDTVRAWIDGTGC